MIELLEARPPASADDLDAAERKLAELGHRIPASYKAFLADQDGGEPVNGWFSFRQGDKIQDAFVQEFLGVAPVPSPGSNLVRTVQLLPGSPPAGVLPVAWDPHGNLVCLDGREGRDGPVLFWDHEEGFDDGEPDESNLYEISPDLQTFLDSLTETRQHPEPEMAPQPQGWRRLFGRK